MIASRTERAGRSSAYHPWQQIGVEERSEDPKMIISEAARLSGETECATHLAPPDKHSAVEP